MKKHSILIQIFPMVDDIDQLERTLIFLRQNSSNIDRSKFHIILDVTYPLSDYFVDWNNSILKKDFFLTKFEILKKYGDWCDESYFTIDENSTGIIEHCINNIYKYKDRIDGFIWLETDIVFNSVTLNTLLEASLEIKKQTPNYIITPEYVKLWDESWDILVNSNFQSKPYEYEKINDPIDDSVLYINELELEPLLNNTQKIFKFGGGWFTLYSKSLLESIEFPRDIKGYGAIDTFIMLYCYHIAPDTTQYKIKNLVICEDRKYLGKQAYSLYIKNIDRRFEHKEESWNKMISHLKKLNNKI